MIFQKKKVGSRYDGQIAVFGKEFQNHLENLNVFLVGAGALGCELIKNFACMGVACGKEGNINLTDLDTIEKSNLNRQFLFRPPDIGKMKSQIAAKSAKVMNPHLNVHVYETPVGENTEDTFHTKFWRKLDVVVNALDNIDARLYVDSCCMRYQKPLLESGTLGTKANTQVVIPHLTQNYGASRDPPEKEIAVCTEKHFPYKIEHTVQYAKNDFERQFTELPNEVNKFISEPKFVDNLLNNPNLNSNVKRVSLENILSIINKQMTWEKCLEEARNMFEKNFNHRMKQLLYMFPHDAKDSEGGPFWSPPKRPPVPIEFDLKDELHFNYIVSTAHLLAHRHGVMEKRDDSFSFVSQVINNVKVEPFTPKKGERVKVNEKDKTEEGSDDDELKLQELVKALPPRDSLVGRKFVPDKFEKDVDSNHHVDYVYSAANLRGQCYSISPVNRDRIKQIAGKIIPAIATSTCMITGLVGLELYKLAQKKPVEAYRNSYVNLAIPIFAFSEPMPPEKKEDTEESRYEPPGYTAWDSIVVNGDVTLQEMIDQLESKHKLTVTSIALGEKLVFADYIDEHQARKSQKLTDIYTKLHELEQVPKHLNFLEFAVIGDDADNSDLMVELAVVRLFFRENKD